LLEIIDHRPLRGKLKLRRERLRAVIGGVQFLIQLARALGALLIRRVCVKER